MNHSPDYLHLSMGIIFLYGAVRPIFVSKLLGEVSRWPWIVGGCPMSRFSRGLQFAVFFALALLEFARAFLILPPPLPGAVGAVFCLMALLGAFLRDRRLRQNRLSGEI